MKNALLLLLLGICAASTVNAENPKNIANCSSSSANGEDLYTGSGKLLRYIVKYETDSTPRTAIFFSLRTYSRKLSDREVYKVTDKEFKNITKTDAPEFVESFSKNIEKRASEQSPSEIGDLCEIWRGNQE